MSSYFVFWGIHRQTLKGIKILKALSPGAFLFPSREKQLGPQEVSPQHRARPAGVPHLGAERQRGGPGRGRWEEPGPGRGGPERRCRDGSLRGGECVSAGARLRCLPPGLVLGGIESTMEPVTRWSPKQVVDWTKGKRAMARFVPREFSGVGLGVGLPAGRPRGRRGEWGRRRAPLPALASAPCPPLPAEPRDNRGVLLGSWRLSVLS